jgi:hypothetical protein
MTIIGHRHDHGHLAFDAHCSAGAIIIDRCDHGPQQQRIFGARVICGFKPMLHHVKGRLRKLEGRSPLIPDVIYTGGRDKSAHAWGQGDAGDITHALAALDLPPDQVGRIGDMRMLIEHLTEPGDLVIEVCAGLAEWSKAAHELKRRVIACDLKRGGTETILAA